MFTKNIEKNQSQRCRPKKITQPVQWLLELIICVGWMLTAGQAFAWNTNDYQPYNPQEAQEQIPAPLFVVISYAVIWIVLLLFVVSLWRRMQRLARDYDRLRHQLESETGDKKT